MRPVPWMVLALMVGCSSRAPLPPVQMPLASSPDAPFRSSVPAALTDRPDWVAPRCVEQVLSNGLRLVIVPREGAGHVSLAYVARGAGRKPAGYPADVAMLTAATMLDGFVSDEATRPEAVIIAGRALTARVRSTYTVIDLSVLRDGLAGALHVLARTVQAPELSSASIDAAWHAQSADLFDSSRTAEGFLEPLEMALVFGQQHRWALDNRVWAAELENISDSDVRRYHAAAYAPERGSLVIVGDVSEQDALARVEAEFGSWRTARHEPVPDHDTRPQPAERRVFAVLDGGSTTRLSVLHPLPGAHHSDVHALGVLRALLAGWSSPLVSVLRHERGHSYSVQGDLHLLGDGGYMDVVVTVPNWEAGRAAAEILDQIDRLRTVEFTREQLEAAKATYLAGLLPWTHAELAQQLARYESNGLGPKELERATQQVRALDAAELRAVATRHLSSAHASVLALGNFYEFDTRFFRLGSVRKLVPMSRSESE